MSVKKKIEIEVLLKFQDFWRNIFWQTLKKIWIIHVIGLFLIGLGIYGFSDSRGFTTTILLIFMPVAAVLLSLWNIYSSAKKGLDGTKGKIRYSFSEKGYEIFTVVGTSRQEWKNLEEVTETNQDFLFFPRKPLFFIVPKRSFKSDEQISSFKEILRSALGKKANLKN